MVVEGDRQKKHKVRPQERLSFPATDPQVTAWSVRFASASSFVSIFVGTVVLLGWAWRILWLTHISSAFVSMKVNTAIAFIFAGFALLQHVQMNPTKRGRLIGQTCAAMVSIIGSISLIENIANWNAGIDQLFIPEVSVRSGIAGRMSPASALNFTLLGLGILLFDYPRSRPWLVFPVFTIAMITALGYLFGVPAFYGIGTYSPMALHTALLFAITSAGVFAARPTESLMAIVNSNTASGSTTRRLLPALVGVPVAAASLCLYGQRAGLYGTEFGIALVTTANVFFLVVIALWITRTAAVQETARSRLQTIVLDQQAKLRAEGRLLAERMATENLVRESLAEKEILLKEIHHRVKNNLQVISSILKLHAEQITDPAAQAAFQESQGRVRSIALLHEALYQSKNLGRVDIAHYASNLIQMLFRTYGNVLGDVATSVQADGMHLPADTAVPLGLILNELVTNSLKHAFPSTKNSPREISVHAEFVGDHVLFRVADNGVGLPEGVDVSKSKTLGIHLIRTLTRQMGGTVIFLSNNGTTCTLRFPLNAVKDA